ncbi:MAG: hypothetical protein IT426_09370 [Pirellulales bacterium]|nr:hypothetical protein [Pirellulales bacterium]
MHVIETAGLITSDGTLQVIAHVPAQIARGECRVLVVIEEGSHPPQSPPALDLPVLPVASWPDKLSLHREDIYGDRGR